MVKLLHVGIEAGNDKWLAKALKKITDYAEIKPKAPDGDIQELFDKHKPELVFMQIQQAGVIGIPLLKYMADRAVVINWSGDVRDPLPQWYRDFDKYCVTCFSNMHDCNELGAEFLQIGIDTDIYRRWKHTQGSDIVFMANWSSCFPLSQYRWDAVESMKNKFRHRFQVCGGWPGAQYNFNGDQYEEAKFYSGSKVGISISHFNYGRYFSDRLIRIMGSGCLTLSHHYEGIEEDFEVGEHLDTFSCIEEMLTKADYYCRNDYQRQRIAQAGYEHAQKNFSVDVMAQNILKIYEQAK